MKGRLLIVLGLLCLLVGCDDSQNKPEEMEQYLDPGAKGLIEQAFNDVDPSKLRDHHVHIVGVEAAQGTEVNERMFQWWHPLDRLKAAFYMGGAGVSDLEQANEQYIERLVSLIRADPHHGKYHILAFDRYYHPDGKFDVEKSEFYTSNDYVVNLAKKYPDIFVPVISVHPYRKDAIAELTKWAEQGIKWVKWLPNAQGMNPADPAIDPYYEVMKNYGMALLSHVGEEKAVHAEEDQKLGNPLLFRRPLDLGVKVVMAHCASLGENEDLDHSEQKATNFELFMRLMDDPRYEGLLYGEISAITQVNRLPEPLLALLERPDLHPRLINGSDYPLPAINVVIQTRALVKYGMITKAEREYLNEIYAYNPLLFDYVLKRTLRHPKTGQKLKAEVFMERL